MKTFIFTSLIFLLSAVSITAAAADVIWQEAEQFDSVGKWSNDPQHIDIMGSPYLLATGLGKPVDDAVTTVKVEKKGTYTLWVRCRDWIPSHSPGQFQVKVNGKASDVTYGKAKSDQWQWIDGGKFKLEEGVTELCLHDTTGWWGRCDAIVLATKGFIPSNDIKVLADQRLKYAGVSSEIKDKGNYDLVVVGGGPAGMGAAIAAARNGIKVAFIQDRPVLGGNASSEIQVPPMGYIGKPPDKKNVTGMTAELFPKQGRTNYADSEKMERIVRAESNISLFLNTRAVDVEMDSKTRIKSVIALDVHSGKRMRFSAPLFADTTGHGWIGFYAGAQWRMGQEARAEFNESLAPIEPGNRTQGNTLYKAIIADRKEPVPFDCPEWAYQWKSSSDFEKRGSHIRRKDTIRPENFDRPSRGKGRNPGNDPDGGLTHNWWVEYGGIENTIEDAEHIRDELFRINIGLWNYAKNHNPATKEKNIKRQLVWLNYVPGVRESRRLVGDYIMTQRDYDNRIVHDDTVAFTDWGPDCHHPEGFWVKGNDCIHTYKGRRTSIPYRTLYSKNIENLFMAGRCHSATHIALGGTRVMRPMCATGQAAGTAAAIATKYKTSPRGVYENHIKELQDTLVKDGCRLMKKNGGMREPSESSVIIADKPLYIAADWSLEHGRCQPVPLCEVNASGYLGNRINRNTASVLAGLESNLLIGFEAQIAGKQLPPGAKRLAADSDLYKWLEGACYVFARTGDQEVKDAIDRIATMIIKCQHDDGYINTQVPPKKRFDPSVRHDLYIAGHFFEAAVAHYRVTGQRNLLDVARRWADYLIAEYKNGNPYYTTTALKEHSEYELGLLRLYRATGEKKYLDFSETLTKELCTVGPEVKDIKAGGGRHAVRVGYLLTGMADLYLETGSEEMFQYLGDLWDELVQTRMYVTGAIGSHGESISQWPYDLPHTRDHPERFLGETCASVAMIMFSWRMHGVTAESRYFDVIENTLYNHYLGAIALDGKGTFYYNPMRMVGDLSNKSDHGHKPASSRCMLPKLNRTSCCITNCWRFLGALPEYIFSYDRQGLFVNLYTTSSVNHTLSDGREISLSVETKYPHNGDVKVRFEGKKPTSFKLRLRIPNWCKSATAILPGQKEKPVEPGEYLVIDRMWKNGDTVRLRFDMPVRVIESDPRVKANVGQIVFARGPVLFCLEKEDVDFPVEQATVAINLKDVEKQVDVQWHGDLLDGIHVLGVPGRVSNRQVKLKLVPWSVRASRSEDSRWVIFLPLTEVTKIQRGH